MQGMDAYLGSYKDGILKKLAKDIDDKNAEYLNRLKTKLDAKEANWVWQQEMIDEKIDEVICEYEIMVNSRFYVSVNAKFKDLLEEWRRKCQDLKHACDAVKPHLSPEMAQFADVLKAIYASGSLTREDCTIMRDVLDSHRSEVTRFFDIHEQYKLFKLIFANDLADLDDDEKQKIYDEQCDSHVWNHDLSSFMENTRRKIAQYINESARGRLLDLWKAKTGSDNPKKWSERYMMPILCMFEGLEQREAEEMFEIINCGTTDNDKVHMAMRYLEDADFYTRLADQNARDEAFKRVIIGEFDALCDDMDDVRDRLESTAESPYSWYNSPRVRNEMKFFAQEKYDSSGCDIAIEKIENMDPEEAKQYLKTLIRDNMNVGMEIIRKHKG